MLTNNYLENAKVTLDVCEITNITLLLTNNYLENAKVTLDVCKNTVKGVIPQYPPKKRGVRYPLVDNLLHQVTFFSHLIVP